MRLGLVSDSLAHLSFEQVLDTAAEMGLAGVEVNTGNWSSAPHFGTTLTPINHKF